MREPGAAFEAARTIDELLFIAGPWYGLDADNQRVPGVRAATLDQALALIGQGVVTTFFGRLRAGVVAVDIDMARGSGVVAELVAWCTERDLWHLVRPSGRTGHAHVLIVAGEREEDLEVFCDVLRTAWAVSRTRIDVRTAVRPLSAPHRSGLTPPLPPGLTRAARALRRTVTSLPATVDDAPRQGARVVAMTARNVPRTVPKRELPADWADYLAAGIPPAQVAGWADASRSAVESTATWQMAAAGWDAERAWLAISQAHPRAFTKARSKRRAWWTACVWNPAVDAVTATPRELVQRRDTERDASRRIEAHRAAWMAIWTRYPCARRHTLRRVLDVLLDRMTRTGSERVPCPQRDLQLDTGLSRPTVASALEQLHADGWLVLERSFDPSDDSPDARSHHAALPAAPPIRAPKGGGLSASSPPRSFTPQPPWSPTALATAALLGPRLWHLYLAIRSLPTPTTPADAAQHAGWTDFPPGTVPSARTVRTVSAGLDRLAAAGLASCTPDGAWQAHDLDQATTSTVEAAEATHVERRTRIELERTAYAQVRAGHGTWHRQREQAIRRGAVARRLGAQRWWAQLDPPERDRRRRAWAEHYRTLAPGDQSRVKQSLAEQRQLTDTLSEDQLHQVWLSTLSQREYDARVSARVAWFRSVEMATQRALVGVWQAHRDRWGIQRRNHSPTAVLTWDDPADAAAIHRLAAGLGARPRPTDHRAQQESA